MRALLDQILFIVALGFVLAACAPKSPWGAYSQAAAPIINRDRGAQP